MRPLAELAERHRVVFVDAPVQGSKQPAEQGQLVVLALGPVSARPVVQPIFDVIGGRTLGIADSGAEGASSRLKLALNTWCSRSRTVPPRCWPSRTGWGVDPGHIVEAITGGPLDNTYFQTKVAAIRADDYRTNFSVSNAQKDARLVVQAAEDAGVRVDVTAAGLERFDRAAAAGHGDKDMAATYLASFEE